MNAVAFTSMSSVEVSVAPLPTDAVVLNWSDWIATEPAVQQAWYVTGDGDYVLVVTARDVEDYEALMQRLVADNPNIRRFRTRVSLGTLKRGLAVPAESGW